VRVQLQPFNYRVSFTCCVIIGFARRYFTLYESGILVYSFAPNHPIRDQVALLDAAISTTPGRKDIHIDSNTATFHIKCLSGDDFTMWMAALRSIPVPLSGQLLISIYNAENLWRPRYASLIVYAQHHGLVT
jgi:hypothetical protein